MVVEMGAGNVRWAEVGRRRGYKHSFLIDMIGVYWKGVAP
jgi:hypothetical protein